MKKLILLLFPILLIGCASIKPVYEVKTYIIDYSGYVENGFFITESPFVSFEYSPVASIEVKVEDGYQTREVVAAPNGYYSNHYDHIKEANVYDALDELQNKCKELGANGLMNLKLNVNYKDFPQNSGKVITQTIITVSGMAIKY